MAASGGVPCIGSHISLTTKSSIRYAGTLYHIDINESTVALKDVRSFGTESRPSQRFIPPSPDVYEYITFRGPEIIDLHVVTTPDPIPSAAPPVARPTTDDFPPHLEPDELAPTSELFHPESYVDSQPNAQSQARDNPVGPTRTGGNAPSVKRWGPPPSAASSYAAAQAAAVLSSASRGSTGVNGSLPSQGTPPRRGPPPCANPHASTSQAPQDTNGVNAPVAKRRQRGSEGTRQNSANGSSKKSSLVLPNEEFDFEAMNAKFDKTTLTTTLQGVGTGAGICHADVAGLDGDSNTRPGVVQGRGAGEELEKIGVKYNKSASFFDELEAPGREHTTPAERALRRNADFETFGETHSGQHQYHYRDGRGRSRYGGGRGRGRGRRGGWGYGHGGQSYSG